MASMMREATSSRGTGQHGHQLKFGNVYADTMEDTGDGGIQVISFWVHVSIVVQKKYPGYQRLWDFSTTTT
jgi:hypothetical protein